MPCLIIVFALISPRITLFFMWVFGDMIGRATEGWIVPMLGFFLLPWTLVVYVLMYDIGTRDVNGFEWFFVALAFLADVVSYGGAARGRGDEAAAV